MLGDLSFLAMTEEEAQELLRKGLAQKIVGLEKLLSELHRAAELLQGGAVLEYKVVSQDIWDDEDEMTIRGNDLEALLNTDHCNVPGRRVKVWVKARGSDETCWIPSKR